MTMILGLLLVSHPIVALTVEWLAALHDFRHWRIRDAEAPLERDGNSVGNFTEE
jgi:hypothetical protein